SIVNNIITTKYEFDTSVNPPQTNSTNGMNFGGPIETLDILVNTVTRTTAHGIDLSSITGDALVQGNIMDTGEIGRGGGVDNFVDGIRCVGPGRYQILGNTLSVGSNNAAGIRLGGTSDGV